MLKFLDAEYTWGSTTLWEFLEEGNVPSGYRDFFSEPQVQDELWSISEAIRTDVESGLTVYPTPNRVFRALSVAPSQIRVGVLGQDPYHNGAAVGYCFAVEDGYPINPSLRNIYTELENCGVGPSSKPGDLSHLVRQGCLLLNSALTVRKSEPNSHSKVWDGFMRLLLRHIIQENPQVVWLLMGASAVTAIDAWTPKGLKVRSVVTTHPSPFSAYRGTATAPAFIGSFAFREVNELLGDEPIRW